MHRGPDLLAPVYTLLETGSDRICLNRRGTEGDPRAIFQAEFELRMSGSGCIASVRPRFDSCKIRFGCFVRAIGRSSQNSDTDSTGGQ
jgi:hypothetical protein